MFSEDLQEIVRVLQDLSADDNHPDKGCSGPFRALPRPDAPGTPLTAPVVRTVRRGLLSVHNKHNTRQHPWSIGVGCAGGQLASISATYIVHTRHVSSGYVHDLAER